jgi:SAM-dependent methyltransferase
MPESSKNTERLSTEAQFQDDRVTRALHGEREVRDRFYFITRRAVEDYENMQFALQGRHVVVVGCSDGGVTPLARRGIHVEGIDISPVAIEKLNEAIRAEGLSDFGSARVMNAESLDYPRSSVDAITCTGVLHHLDSEAALRSWSRSLKPDGEVLMYEPLALHPLVALFRAVTPSMRTPEEHPLRGRDFRLMRKYFGKVERRDYGLFTPLSAAIAVVPGLGGLARGLLPLWEVLDGCVLKVLPFMGRFCWMSVVRLTRPAHDNP